MHHFGHGFFVLLLILGVAVLLFRNSDKATVINNSAPNQGNGK